MWLYGNQLRWMSSGVCSATATTLTALLSRLPCVRMTPLGLPVVPDVYMIVARSSGPMAASRLRRLGRQARQGTPAALQKRIPRDGVAVGRAAIEDDDAAQGRQFTEHRANLVELLAWTRTASARRHRPAESESGERSGERAAAR